MTTWHLRNPDGVYADARIRGLALSIRRLAGFLGGLGAGGGGEGGPPPFGETTLGLLDELPPYLANDPSVQRVMYAFGNELDRLNLRQQELREQLFPQNADDTYGILQMFEALYGLPAVPEGISLGDRRANVLSNIRNHRISHGTDWIDRVTSLLGTHAWSHLEVSPYQVLVLIPYPSPGYKPGQVAKLLRRITPAHLGITVAFEGRFLVEITPLGSNL